jgi:hypothetical protein
MPRAPSSVLAELCADRHCCSAHHGLANASLCNFALLYILYAQQWNLMAQVAYKKEKDGSLKRPGLLVARRPSCCRQTGQLPQKSDHWTKLM